jgi:hypothetical protein
MNCQFCSNKCTNMKLEEINSHLVITERASDGHTYVHGPVKNSEKMEKFARMILREAKIEFFEYKYEEDPYIIKNKKEIIKTENDSVDVEVKNIKGN